MGDIIYATFHITELIYRHIATHPDGFTGKFLCLLRNGAFQWIGASSSIFTLVAIAFERYFAVLYPYANKGKLTMRKLKVCELVLFCSTELCDLLAELAPLFQPERNKTKTNCAFSLYAGWFIAKFLSVFIGQSH